MLRLPVAEQLAFMTVEVLDCDPLGSDVSLGVVYLPVMTSYESVLAWVSGHHLRSPISHLPSPIADLRSPVSAPIVLRCCGARVMRGTHRASHGSAPVPGDRSAGRYMPARRVRTVP